MVMWSASPLQMVLEIDAHTGRWIGFGVGGTGAIGGANLDLDIGQPLQVEIPQDPIG